jgi:hypothetical protein
MPFTTRDALIVAELLRNAAGRKSSLASEIYRREPSGRKRRHTTLSPMQTRPPSGPLRLAYSAPFLVLSWWARRL